MIALLLISTLRFTIDVQRASATIPGDLNGNNMVDIFDAIILVKSYTVVRGSPSWNSNADINKDGVVDMLDALILAKYFGDSGSSNKPIVYANGTALYAPVTGQIVTFKGTQVDYEVLSGKHDSDKPGTLQQDYWFNYTDVKKLKSYGCNLVEFHDIVWKDMMPQKGIFDASWFATNSDRWVSWIRQEGMYCILSMSNFEYQAYRIDVPDWMLEKYPKPWTEATVEQANIDFWNIDNPLQEEARQLFIDTWKTIAIHYLNDSNVMFGIMNEPFSGNSLVNGQNAAHLSICYARFIEKIIDGIRSTGSEQLIFVDKPYCWFSTSHYEPVNRDNIIWEDHLYVNTPDIQSSMDINRWKSTLNEYVNRYIHTFGKPFYLGEYSFWPHEIAHDGRMPNWKANLTDQVHFLKTLPLCGYAWHQYPALHGEWYDWYYTNNENKDYFTKEESDFILEAIFS